MSCLAKMSSPSKSSFPADIEYTERGAGPALLFVPGGFATGAAWKPVIERLGDGYRCVTTSLLGYGRTADPRPADAPPGLQQVEVLDAIIARIAAPVHVIAHSFGGACVLAHALHGRHQAASLTLVDAAPMSILQTAGETAHAASIGALRERYFADFAAGRPDAARPIIDFFGGAGTYDAFPEKTREAIRAALPGNVRDWAFVAWFSPSLADYRRIGAPACVLRGEHTPPPLRRIAELLAENLPAARLETVAGAGHFLLATHPDAVARAIAAHVTRATA